MELAGKTRSHARMASEGPALRENQDWEVSPTELHRDQEASPTEDIASIEKKLAFFTKFA